MLTHDKVDNSSLFLDQLLLLAIFTFHRLSGWTLGERHSQPVTCKCIHLLKLYWARPFSHKPFQFRPLSYPSPLPNFLHSSPLPLSHFPSDIHWVPLIFRPSRYIYNCYLCCLCKQPTLMAVCPFWSPVIFANKILSGHWRTKVCGLTRRRKGVRLEPLPFSSRVH